MKNAHRSRGTAFTLWWELSECFQSTASVSGDEAAPKLSKTSPLQNDDPDAHAQIWHLSESAFQPPSEPRASASGVSVQPPNSLAP
jgi:hypothetical protein